MEISARRPSLNEIRYISLGIDNKLRSKNGTTVRYFLTDHLGSTEALTDATGKVVSSTSYDSFGNATKSIPTSYQYTGREYDSDTGLYYYRNRWYDPEIGRFTSKDPIGFAGGDINLYGYVGNSPLGFTDPLGNYPCRQHRKAVKDAVARAGERLKSEKCATAITGLLRSSFRELRKGFENLDTEEEKYINDHINKNMTAENVYNILVENEKNFKIEYSNPNLTKNGYISATLTEVGSKMTFTLYRGFFKEFKKGRFDKDTTLDRRAMTLIHEGIHAVSPDFNDEFVGKIAVGINKKIKNTGSQAITDFVMKYCMPKN